MLRLFRFGDLVGLAWGSILKEGEKVVPFEEPEKPFVEDFLK